MTEIGKLLSHFFFVSRCDDKWMKGTTIHSGNVRWIFDSKKLIRVYHWDFNLVVQLAQVNIAIKTLWIFWISSLKAAMSCPGSSVQRWVDKIYSLIWQQFAGWEGERGTEGFASFWTSTYVRDDYGDKAIVLSLLETLLKSPRVAYVKVYSSL